MLAKNGRAGTVAPLSISALNCRPGDAASVGESGMSYWMVQKAIHG